MRRRPPTPPSPRGTCAAAQRHTDVQHREASAVPRADIHGEAALGLTQPPLQRAVVVGLDRGVRVAVHDAPRCGAAQRW